MSSISLRSPLSVAVLLCTLALAPIPIESARADGRHHSGHCPPAAFHGPYRSSVRFHSGFGYGPYGRIHPGSAFIGGPAFFGGPAFYGRPSLYGFGAMPYPYYTRTVVAYRSGGSTAAQVQTALARRGFYRGPIDGIIGSGSRRAIRNFQTASRIPATGQIDRNTLYALRLR
jgi:hypothetical protein